MPKGKVQDRDRGYNVLMRNLEVLKEQNPSVVAGIVGADGARVHAPPASRKRGPKEQPLTMAQIAQRNEFGDGRRIPARSFLRATLDEKAEEYKRNTVAGLRSTLRYSVAQNKVWDPLRSVALKRVALKLEGDIKQRIANGIAPPNRPMTIRLKGSSKPLIDTGQLRRSITALVRKATPGGSP